MARDCSDTRSSRRRRSLTRVAVSTVRDIKSPLERLGVNLASRSPPA